MKALPFLLIAATSVAQAASCDRTCLRGFLTQYLYAMVTHNPKAVAISDKVRFTEDAVDMKPGEGLWKGASKIRDWVGILDVKQGVAATEVVVEENGTPVMLALRLKVAGKKITEIETQVTRTQKEGGLFAIDAIKTVSPVMLTAPEKSQLMRREDAIKTAMYYPAGLKIGSFVKVDAPFAPDAYRVENGVRTAGQGCARAGCENIKAQTIMEHPGITTRVLAVDEQSGIVLLRMNFGQTKSYGEGNALQVWEAFKVYGGKIHAVEAFMKIMPVTIGDGGWK
jgi:hypothetical protein